jgi:hypothetical protein
MLPILMALIVALPGCGPGEELGHVTGRVFWQGEPVTTGTITFEDSSRGLGIIVPIGPDGRYEMRTYRRPGLLPGTYRVCFSPYPLSAGDMLVAGPKPPPVPAPTGKFPPVPEKYFNITTSGLEAEVDKGENTFDFRLP